MKGIMTAQQITLPTDMRLSKPTTTEHPLVALRVAQGLSRERLAQLAGVSARTIYGIERDGNEPRRATALVISMALGCSPDAITGTNA